LTALNGLLEKNRLQLLKGQRGEKGDRRKNLVHDRDTEKRRAEGGSLLGGKKVQAK